MPSITMQPGSDPVSQAIAHSALMAGARPVPLVSTAYDIDIRGGLPRWLWLGRSATTKRRASKRR